MVTLIQHMVLLVEATSIGQHQWLHLLIQVFLGACANNLMLLIPWYKFHLSSSLLLSYCSDYHNLARIMYRLTLAMDFTVISSRQTLRINQKYGVRCGLDGEPSFLHNMVISDLNEINSL